MSIYPETAIAIYLGNNGPKMTLSAREAVNLAIIQLVKGKIDRWNDISKAIKRLGIRIDLSGLFAPDMIMPGIDLSSTDLIKSVFCGCDLRLALFGKTDISGMDINGAFISKRWRSFFNGSGAANADKAVWS